jgi:hydrogenase expression/formation protein HypD
MVYSPQEALEIAEALPDKDVVFFGAGFETTIPAIAMTAKEAFKEKIRNYAVLSALWVIPPPLRAILDAGEIKLTGFLYPGHVSAIIGMKPYMFIPKEYGLPGAIAGFEPADILLGVLSVLDQAVEGTPRVAIEYTRVVRPEGNPLALAVMEEMLELKDAVWRGLGSIPKSGLRLREKYAAHDAEIKYGLALRKTRRRPSSGCRCGEVLRGVIEPPACPLFSRKCTPGSPSGPCMVSLEGACYVHYKYGSPERRRHETG